MAQTCNPSIGGRGDRLQVRVRPDPIRQDKLRLLAKMAFVASGWLLEVLRQQEHLQKLFS